MTLRIGILSLAGLFGIFHNTCNAEIPEAAKLHLNQSTAAGSTWLPAGDYRISLARMQSSLAELVIENVETRTSILVPASRVYAKLGVTPERTGAVLQQQDGKTYLTSIWIEGHTMGYAIIGAIPEKPATPAEVKVTD